MPTQQQRINADAELFCILKDSNRVEQFDHEQASQWMNKRYHTSTWRREIKRILHEESSDDPNDLTARYIHCGDGRYRVNINCEEWLEGIGPAAADGNDAIPQDDAQNNAEEAEPQVHQEADEDDNEGVVQDDEVGAWAGEPQIANNVQINHGNEGQHELRLANLEAVAEGDFQVQQEDGNRENEAGVHDEIHQVPGDENPHENDLNHENDGGDLPDNPIIEAQLNEDIEDNAQHDANILEIDVPQEGLEAQQNDVEHLEPPQNNEVVINAAQFVQVQNENGDNIDLTNETPGIQENARRALTPCIKISTMHQSYLIPIGTKPHEARELLRRMEGAQSDDVEGEVYARFYQQPGDKLRSYYQLSWSIALANQSTALPQIYDLLVRQTSHSNKNARYFFDVLLESTDERQPGAASTTTDSRSGLKVPPGMTERRAISCWFLFDRIVNDSMHSNCIHEWVKSYTHKKIIINTLWMLALANKTNMHLYYDNLAKFAMRGDDCHTVFLNALFKQDQDVIQRGDPWDDFILPNDPPTCLSISCLYVLNRIYTSETRYNQFYSWIKDYSHKDRVVDTMNLLARENTTLQSKWDKLLGLLIQNKNIQFQGYQG